MNEKKNKTKEALISSLNKARCLSNRYVGNEELAGILLNALPKDIWEAIERATPKKPIKIAKGSAYGCPFCKSVVYIKSLSMKKAVCPECGQRLDWSEE